jgi:adenosylcobinamide kinase/adenosylcobinamide-phosphate guanylyltransferase
VKILYYGGQKCGKSYLAEQKSLQLSDIVYYVATYDNSYEDKEMESRLANHKDRRDERYITIEEPIDIDTLKPNKTYLIDCISMWIMNMIFKDKESDIFDMLDRLMSIDANIVLVQNDVGSGVIPMDKLSRKYVDISGEVSQYIASRCDEVYHVVCGIGNRIK